MPRALQLIVGEIVGLNDLFNAILNVPIVQVLGPPATVAQIDALEVHLGVALPPSYRELLSICNGWVGFAAGVDLLSVEQQMRGEHARYIHRWRGIQWEYGESVPVEAIIFGIELGTNKARLFDTATADASGEMQAIWWDDGELHRYANLIQMLEEYVERLVFMIDRKRGATTP